MTFDGTLNIQKWEKQVPLSECKNKGGYKIEHHRASSRTKSQGVCCYKGTYKPAGELHAGIVIRTVTTVVERPLPPLLGRGNFSPCYPFPLQSGSRNSGEVFSHGETPPTLSTSYYKFYIGSQNYRYEVTDIRGSSQVS